MNYSREDTICALSTPSGSGAIALIRMSGSKAFDILDTVFSKDKSTFQPNKVLFGNILNGSETVDEVLVTCFKGPHSFSGEDTVEISCHGSAFIIQEIMQLLLNRGARLATAGEFTQRAFMNGKMDLSQAEAVADLIASTNSASHKVALNQMRGGVSNEIGKLREELIHFASMVELELDFAEEDVEFADRQDLKDLVDKLLDSSQQLTDSFQLGNAIKKGIPVAIVGVPNVGKSTLLNAILNEEKAIVSEIAGTTRDSIEDTVVLDGIEFRFVDTAGLRETSDTVETIGIERSLKKAREASIILYLVDAADNNLDRIHATVKEFEDNILEKHQKLFIVVNKIDRIQDIKKLKSAYQAFEEVVFVTAKEKQGLDELKNRLLSVVDKEKLGTDNLIITNQRHYEALKQAVDSLQRVRDGLDNNITGDFLAIDIRETLRHLGNITGEIEIDRDILGNIFGKFCIGK